MIPRKLTLTNYCQHAALTLEIKDGITAIIASNGKGKSNIFNALRFAADGQKSPSSDKMQDDIKDTASFAKVQLSFEYEAGLGTITRTINRNSANSAELSLELNDGRYESYSKSSQAVEQMGKIMGNAPKILGDVLIAPQHDIDGLLFGKESERRARMEQQFHGDLFTNYTSSLTKYKETIHYSQDLDNTYTKILTTYDGIATQVTNLEEEAKGHTQTLLKIDYARLQLRQDNQLKCQKEYDTYYTLKQQHAENKRVAQQLATQISNINKGDKLDTDSLTSTITQAQLHWTNYNVYVEKGIQHAEYMSHLQDSKTKLTELKAQLNQVELIATKWQEQNNYALNTRIQEVQQQVENLLLESKFNSNFTSMADLYKIEQEYLDALQAYNNYVTAENEYQKALARYKTETEVKQETTLQLSQLHQRILDFKRAKAYQEWVNNEEKLQQNYNTKCLIQNLSANREELELQQTNLNKELGYSKTILDLLAQTTTCSCPICNNPAITNKEDLITTHTDLLHQLTGSITNITEQLRTITDELQKANRQLHITQEITQPETELNYKAILLQPIDDAEYHLLRAKLNSLATVEPIAPKHVTKPQDILHTTRKLKDCINEADQLRAQIKGVSAQHSITESERDLLKLLPTLQTEVTLKANEVSRLESKPNPAPQTVIQPTTTIEQLANLRLQLQQATSIEQQLRELLPLQADIQTTIVKQQDEILRLEKAGVITPETLTPEDLIHLNEGLQVANTLVQVQNNILEAQVKKRVYEQQLQEIFPRITQNNHNKGKLARIDAILTKLKYLPTQLLKLQLQSICNEMQTLLKDFQITQFSLSMSDNLTLTLNYPSGISRPISKASGGERNILGVIYRLAAHRYLAPNVPWLALDEPSNQLHTDNIQALSDLLRRISENLPKYGLKVLILITHSNQMATGAQHQIYID